MNQQALMPLLMFLAGAGFNEVAYAIGKLQRGFSGMTGGGGSGAGPSGIPQALSMLSGAMPQAHGPDTQIGPGGAPGQPDQTGAQQLGPNPLQALAMLDLKRRMAEAQLQGGGGGLM